MTKDLYLKNIIGQEKAKTLLAMAVTSERLAHSYLFKGPAGIGKKRTARSFAAFINCRRPTADDCCGACPSCRKFFSDNHPDFVHIEPEGDSIRISQVRELKRQLNFPAFEAQYRVVLLPEAQNMRREAANSLLKTLEEPPGDTILILTASESGVLLPTILSRCQVIPFFPLAHEAIGKILARERDISQETATTIGALAAGSLGKAKEFLTQAKLLNIRQEVITQLAVLQNTQAEAVETILGLAEQAARLKEKLPQFLDFLKLWLRDLVLLHQALPGLIINRDLFSALEKARMKWTVPEILTRIEAVALAQKQLEFNCNKTFVCEVLFFKLI